MKRHAILLYGITCYALFFLTFLYTPAFLGDFGIVPKTIDSGVAGPVWTAVAVNLALLALFALQHSVMARPGFKAAWTKIVPAAAERSTYVLASTVAMVALFALWQPLPTPVWRVEDALARSLLTGGMFGGLAIVLVSTFLIDHFDLFGLRQVVLQFRGRAYTEKRFVTPGPYKWIRHPLYVGWLLAFWSTPDMTAGHLLFALVASGYIFTAIVFEERDLIAALGEDYRAYRERTPMMIPRLSRRAAGSPAQAAAKS